MSIFSDTIDNVSRVILFERRAKKINRLAEVRKAKGMTQRRLSFLSGVHRVSIARYESGRVSPNVRVLEKLAVALNVPLDDLIDRKVG